jgi:hypothetical protein
MATINKLRREIDKQKGINSGLKELKELSKEKERLELEYNLLKRDGKPKTNWGKIGGELKNMGNKLMDVANEGRKNLESKDRKGLGLW